ncbi:uncharacterized protein LOC115692545 [Syzygium oleosum]|uniref:uncharacterized protein LOC115692545 n=1 Tax=Syzygium oleosum TaxID=219896 RepID=UPI0024BA9B8D|nr:uncharacterized protein LOC115692545 [Syzygium oleosum]
MANIEKPKFHILEVSGNNYLSWCLDMETHLQGQDFANAITEDGTSNAKDKANALIFIRRHLHESLQTQYLSVRDPQTLWKRLKDRYDHTKTVILPQAQYDWQNLRLQDFKSVSDYNSALFDIVSRLELCGIKLTDAELLEKTFSTFHALNIVLQQQYRQRQFDTYSELISVLLTTEQTNELLLKNHDLRPAGSKALPEAHANSEKITGHFKGYKRRQEYNPRRGGRKFNRPRKSNFGPNHDKEKKPKKVTNESICHRCGMTGHWLRTCRTPKHFVDLYQASLKNTGKRGESHAIEINPAAITTVEANNISVGGTPLAPEVANASLDVFDFFEDL